MEAVPGARLIDVVLRLSGELVQLGIGSSPGVGTCERYLAVGSAASASAPFASRGGTGEMLLKRGTGPIWCNAGNCRPWREDNDRRQQQSCAEWPLPS